MRTRGSTGVESLDLQVERLARRARLNLAAAFLVWGAFIGGAAGVLYALVSDFIRLPLHPLLFAAIAAAAGAGIGAALGALSPQSPVRLLIRADRALANHELSSTAYELATRAKKSLFSEAIIEDAVGSLSGSDPAKILGRPRMRLLPFLPLILAASLMLSIFPMNLRELFSPKPQVEPAIRSLGEDLESFGKKLEKKAIEENLQRSFQLSQELQRLGKDFQSERIDESEAQSRLQQLESQLADDYSLKMEELMTHSQGEGPGGMGKPGESRSRENSGQGQEGGEESGSENPGADAESQDLSDALNMLSQKRQSLGMNPPQGKPVTPQPGAKSLGQDKGESPQQGEGEEMPAHGGEGDSQGQNGEDQAQAGKNPVKDQQGPATDIERAKAGESFHVQTPVTEGDKVQMLLRALPGTQGSKVPDTEQLLRYQRTAETALAREDVPVELRQYVREYFISIGMMGK